MTDKPFISGSLLLSDQNISNVAHLNKKFQEKKSYSIPVSASSQKLGHYNYKFSNF